MSNHFTFTYPPTQLSSGGSNAANVTEILVTDDHAVEAVQMLVRAIEFLRVVYCGGARNDVFAVPPRYVAAVEDAPPPRKPTRSVSPGSTSPASRPSQPPSGRTTPQSRSRTPTAAGRAREPENRGPPRPYDSIACPVSARSIPSVAGALHAAAGKVSSMPFFTTLRKSGTNDKNAAPFVLRVRVGKSTDTAGLLGYGGGRRLEVFEEWEFHFVKVKPNTHVGGSSSGVAVTSDNNSSVFRPTPSITGASVAQAQREQQQPSELQHALGLAPQSLTPNDPAKLRDALHFLNMKALQAIDTFVIDELRVTTELVFDVTVTPSERGTPLCRSTPEAPKPPPTGGDKPQGSVVSAIGGSIASFWRRQ